MSSPTHAPGVHARVNRGLLAEAERRTLVWIAHRLPRWMHSDHLSAIGLAGMALTGGAFAAAGALNWAPLLVVVGLAVNWFGDSLDGTLARVRNAQRPRYGYYVDHALDIVGTALLFGGMAAGGVMTPIVAASLLAVYFAVMAEVFLATHVGGVFRMSFAGVGPTELRLVLAAGALALPGDPRVPVAGFGSVALFDVGGVVGAMGLAMTFLVSAVRMGRALHREEGGARLGVTASGRQVA